MVVLLFGTATDSGGWTMKRMLLATMLVMQISGPAWGMDEQGEYFIFGPGNYSCSEFIGRYRRADVRRAANNQLNFNVEFGGSIGWIQGYLTAVNAMTPGKIDYFVSMDSVDVIEWIASWCRENPRANLYRAVEALVKAKLL
jgi:hypothetical protein